MNDDYTDEPCHITSVPDLSDGTLEITNAVATTPITFRENVPVQLDATGMVLNDGADITVDGVSLRQFITDVNNRMLLLHEDVESHELYPALKEAYDKYKVIEALLKIKK